MDKRKRKRAVLTAGLLFVLAVFLIGETCLFGHHLQEIERSQMGELAVRHPEWEQEIVTLFQGKTNGLDSGNALAEKYGMRGISGSRLREIYPYGILLFATVCVGIVGILLLWKRTSDEDEQILEDRARKEEELRELMVRYDAIKSRLEKEESDTKTLITDISHQLKTPVASLKVSYELMESTPLSAQERQEFRRKEYEELKKLELLMESLMNLSKLETRMIQICPVPASLKETLRTAVSNVYMKALDKQVEISMEEFSDLQICHDPKWTAEVFVNVLDNGIKYSKENTKIIIRVSKLVSCVLIEVQDEGIGVEPKEMHQIFKRFYRGGSEEVQKTEGSGVGLYLARRIIEEQGGTIRVKAAVPRGSVFQITLPRSETERLDF